MTTTGMTQHFNALSEAEQERLAILIEECGEVVQIACKILRHGYGSTNIGRMSETNRRQLERELGDLLYVIEMMENSQDVSGPDIHDARTLKPNRMLPYLHHQNKP